MKVSSKGYRFNLQEWWISLTPEQRKNIKRSNFNRVMRERRDALSLLPKDETWSNEGGTYTKVWHNRNSYSIIKETKGV